jgi:hypothetical protein
MTELYLVAGEYPDTVVLLLHPPSVTRWRMPFASWFEDRVDRKGKTFQMEIVEWGIYLDRRWVEGLLGADNMPAPDDKSVWKLDLQVGVADKIAIVLDSREEFKQHALPFGGHN